MILRTLSILITIALLLVSCDGTKPSKELTDTKPQHLEDGHHHRSKDDHTYSNLEEINTTHLHLDFDINFENKVIYGVARHEMFNTGVEKAIFDISGLKIQKVTLGKDKETATDYYIGTEDPILGAPLEVKVEKNTKFVNIYYETTEKSNALDWLKPALTSGKKLPFLYTQGQAILTRTWIPLQDSPSNRITYSAQVKVPSDLLAIMSASNPKEKNSTGIYNFEMKQPIPCYLIAIAVGDIAYKSLGENCGVYSEPALLEDAAYEFADLPKMIDAAEALYGEYKWEVYDIVVLPYSFPFGGMENPRLTFANPTLISGDRSSTSVIAHELAHSWSGNLVTNATWDDFWLNEGFTVYFENRIMEAIYGLETADMLALIEYQELENSNREMLEGVDGLNPKDTRLKLELDGRNPDDGMTDIAYVKGAFFLKTLEKVVGREKFDVFLKGYFETHQFQTLTTEDFVDYLNANLLEKYNVDFNTHEWIYENGIPANCLQISSPRFTQVEELAIALNEGKEIVSKLERDQYIMQEWLAFLRKIDVKKVTPEQLRALDAKIDFKGWGNSEIMEEWFGIGIQVGYLDIIPEMTAFLTKVGRRKFLKPLYSKLAVGKYKGLDLELAKKIFKNAKQNYHAVSAGTIEDILYK